MHCLLRRVLTPRKAVAEVFLIRVVWDVVSRSKRRRGLISVQDLRFNPRAIVCCICANHIFGVPLQPTSHHRRFRTRFSLTYFMYVHMYILLVAIGEGGRFETEAVTQSTFHDGNNLLWWREWVVHVNTRRCLACRC